MQSDSADLTPHSRTAVPDTAAEFSPERVLWHDIIPGGAHWSGLLRRGTTLRLTDLDGSANAAVLLFNQEEKAERYNMPDTLKAQHTAFLTQGNVCMSDMGRILCSISEDTCGWHDTVCGVHDARSLQARFGTARFQEFRNEMFRNGRDGFLIELKKWGLDRRDIGANLNFFSKIVPDEAGNLQFETTHRQPGQYVDLRCEMNVLLVLSAAPHPFDTASVYAPGPVQLTAWHSGPAPAQDACRQHCPENQRAFINTERWFN